LAREGGDRGFAAGAGHGSDRLGLAWIKGGGGKRQRAPRIGDRDDGNLGRYVSLALRQHRGGAGGERLRHKGEAVALGAWYRDEQFARLDLAAVGGNSGKLQPGETRVEAGTLQRQIGKLHGQLCYPQLRQAKAVTGFPSRWPGSPGRPW